MIEGTTEVNRQCTKCQKGGPPTEDPFTSLHIEFKEENISELNVEEAIRKLQCTEKFECECYECGGEESVKETKLKKLPEVLTLQIKRFVCVPGKKWLMKNDTIVDYPREMKLGESSYELYNLLCNPGVNTLPSR